MVRYIGVVMERLRGFASPFVDKAVTHYRSARLTIRLSLVCFEYVL